jgi:predicted permease
MLIVLGILLPVFGLIAIGYCMARTPLLKSEGVRGLGSFVYYVALPALLFRSTATPPPARSSPLSSAAPSFSSSWASCLPASASA